MPLKKKFLNKTLTVGKEIKKIESTELHRAIDRIAESIAARHSDSGSLSIVGIADGGISFAQTLARRLSDIFGKELPCGAVNTAFHRDDFGHNPIPKSFQRTDIPLNVEGATVILADDVLFTGRTARAAMNEIFDMGRPERVELAVLCDRGNRCLPIQADYTGFVEDTTPEQQVEVVINIEDPSGDSLIIYAK